MGNVAKRAFVGGRIYGFRGKNAREISTRHRASIFRYWLAIVRIVREYGSGKEEST